MMFAEANTVPLVVSAAALTTEQLLLALFTGAAAGALIGLVGVFVRISHERTERKRDRLIDAADQFAVAGARLAEVAADLAVSSLVATSYASAVQQAGPSSDSSQEAQSTEDTELKKLERQLAALQELTPLLPRLHGAAVAVGDSLYDLLSLPETTLEDVSPELRTLIGDLNELPFSPPRDQALQTARDLRQKHSAIRHAVRAKRAADEAFDHFAQQLPRLIILFAPRSAGAQSPVVAAAHAARAAGLEAIRVASFPWPEGVTREDVAATGRDFRASVETFAVAVGAAVRERRL